MTRKDRTLAMKENYIALHEAGMSATEIADKYGLANSTVYRALPEIAEKAGVTRESLLSRTRSTKQVAETDEEASSVNEVEQATKPGTATEYGVGQTLSDTACDQLHCPIETSGQNDIFDQEDFLRVLEGMRNLRKQIQTTLENVACYDAVGEE